MQKRNVLNSPRLLELQKKRQKILLMKVSLCVFGFLALCGSLIYILRLPAFSISSVKVEGGKVIDAGVVKTIAEKDLQGNYLWVFPKMNFFLYPKNLIKNQISQQFLRLKDVKFSVKNKVLLVTLSEREAKYTWCGETPSINETTDQKCYFVDPDGYVFDEAPYFSGEVYFKFYGSAGVGNYFQKENFKQLVSLRDDLISLNIKPSSLYADDTKNVKVFLLNPVKTNPAPYIIFKLDSDYKKLVENLQTILSTEPFKFDFKNKYGSLEYIDLRYGNKVYYKFH